MGGNDTTRHRIPVTYLTPGSRSKGCRRGAGATACSASGRTAGHRSRVSGVEVVVCAARWVPETRTALRAPGPGDGAPRPAVHHGKGSYLVACG